MSSKAEAQSTPQWRVVGSVSGGAKTQHSTINARQWEHIEALDVELMWNEPLSNHTTFRVGGPVACLARPLTEEALLALLREVRHQNIPHFILGGGSNVLPPDDPWDGIAIQLTHCCSKIMPLEESSDEKVRLYVGAGTRLARWLRYCLVNGLGGVESLVGIPGSVGGALVMNAGTREGCMADVLIWADVVDASGNRLRVVKSDLSVSYRSLGLQKDWIVLGGCFELHSASSEDLKAQFLEKMRRRRASQPLGAPSAGCIFKNPPDISAGALIEQSGLKGLRIGDAEVSTKHANWIINRGNAKARDILQLMEHIEKRVFEDFGVLLGREIHILNP